MNLNQVLDVLVNQLCYTPKIHRFDQYLITFSIQVSNHIHGEDVISKIVQCLGCVQQTRISPERVTLTYFFE